MKVLIINGSPRPNGCTSRGLKEVEKVLNDEGIATKFVNIAGAVIPGCVACGYCEKHGECFRKDIVNELVRELKDADGLLIGTPVYYAGSNGSLLSLLDRMFYSKGFPCTMKVGAAIASSRRAGSNTALDEIEKYFSISGMPIVTSTYWNEVHGFSSEDVEKDLEGLQTMRNLGRNMVFLMKAIALGKQEYGIPEQEKGCFTSFPDGLGE